MTPSSRISCFVQFRPALRRNCSSGACDACWRTGPWRPCTAACGRGFQSRKVDCVHASSCQPVAERHCVQDAKPSSWQHCVGPSCDRTYPSQVSRLSQVSDPRGARLVGLGSEGPVRTEVVSWDTTKRAALMWAQLGLWRETH